MNSKLQIRLDRLEARMQGSRMCCDCFQAGGNAGPCIRPVLKHTVRCGISVDRFKDQLTDDDLVAITEAWARADGLPLRGENQSLDEWLELISDQWEERSGDGTANETNG